MTLGLVTEAGAGGYPGPLEVEVTYRLEHLGDDLVWTIDYRAETERPTLCSLTQHSYFNLAGHAAGHFEGQSLQIFAEQITELDEAQLPTGRLLPVEGTALDYRSPRPLGEALDHNFVLGLASSPVLRPAARFTAPDLCLTVETTFPGLQVYSANYLLGETAKGGGTYQAGRALCLECQAWPDAPHHPNFPSIVLRPDEVYRECTRYRLSLPQI